MSCVDGERPAARTRDSVRYRITMLASSLLLITLLVTGFVLVLVQGNLLVDGVDETIERRADDVASAIVDGSVDRINDPGADTLVQVVRDGVVTGSSAKLVGLDPVAPPPPADRFQTVSTVSGPAGLDGDYRLLSRRYDDGSRQITLHVLGDLGDVDEARTILLVALAVALPLVALLSAAIIWWMVGRTLEPVEAIRAEVADITGAELDRRVPEPGTRDEIDRLTVTMNAMLDRVETAAIEQRRFVDDASHELRSPLTRLRSDLEVSLTHPESIDAASVFARLLDDTVDLQSLVEDLLYLARADASPFVAHDVRQRDGPTPVIDLDDVVLEEAARVPRAVDCDISGVESVRVPSTGGLGRAIRNVIENASRHAASRITVSLHMTGRRATLAISDDGAGVAAADRARIFDRFTRLDEARSADGGGTGLGLAIARDIIVRHRGSITFVDPPKGVGATVMIDLPASLD